MIMPYGILNSGLKVVICSLGKAALIGIGLETLINEVGYRVASLEVDDKAFMQK